MDRTVFPLRLRRINPLNAESNPICHLLALLGAHHIFHVSGLRVNIVFYFNASVQLVSVLTNVNKTQKGKNMQELKLMSQVSLKFIYTKKIELFMVVSPSNKMLKY